jgi:hypothetical protein
MYETGSVCLLPATYIAMPWPMLRRFAAHLIVLADSRALWSAGNRMLMSRAMMPITTNSSTSVNPFA